MLRTAAGLFIAATLVACASFDADWPGPDDPGKTDEPDPEPDPDPDPTPGPDYTNAYWKLVNVSSTPSTISHDPQIAFVGQSPVVSFAEPDSEDLGDQSIHVATTDGLVWTDTRLADGAGEQLAYPSVAATEGAAHLVYSGLGDDGDRDVWIAGRAGGVWSEPLNMTDAGGAEVRQNQRPQVAIAAAGPTALYFSSANPIGTLAEQVEVRAQVMGGEPEVIHTADRSICFDLRVVADAEGNLHAITDCGGFIYMTNAGGSWTVLEVPLGASGAPTVADLSVDPGGSVHLAWAGRTDCPELGQGERCSRIFYSRDLGVPVVVTREGEGGFHPVVGADESGRPLVAFHMNTDGSSRVYVSHSDDGASFEPIRALGEGKDREWLPARLVFGPDKRPHLMFERAITGTDPLDVEIIWATTDD